MQYPAIFAATLGLAHPWQITAVSFAKDEERMDITVDFAGDCIFTCPNCGEKVRICFQENETWFHEDFFRHKTFLHVRIPHAECNQCDQLPIERPWCRSGSRFTRIDMNQLS